MKMEPIQCPETSAYKIQTPVNYPEDVILHPQHGKSLKTTIYDRYYKTCYVLILGPQSTSKTIGSLYENNK
jgi:hypothetical protein